LKNYLRDNFKSYHYTSDDLKKAREELKLWQKRWENYSGNNSDKYQSNIKIAVSNVRMIERELKNAGIIEMTDQEKLNIELDKLYPNARSTTIVEHNGQKYQIRYFPLEKSRSRKTVKEWGHEWVQVE